jgi:U3 small nucleolar RNA-associated protein 25
MDAWSDGFTEMQKSLLSAMSSYRDVLFTHPDVFQERDALMKTYALHALNHLTKTRDKVLKNNARINKNMAEDKNADE